MSEEFKVGDLVKFNEKIGLVVKGPYRHPSAGTKILWGEVQHADLYTCYDVLIEERIRTIFIDRLEKIT